MPDILILPNYLAPGDAGNIRIEGVAMENSAHTFLGWSVQVNCSESPLVVYQLIVEAAIAGFATINVTVGLLDKKLLLCSAI